MIAPPPVLTIRDPIHGFIRTDPLEAALIASRPVQRLRYVHQLGLTSLVFPGAEHSRFAHALGAMELAGRVYDALAAKSDGLLPVRRDSHPRRLVRAAALLHDAGHAPFSHSAEELFEAGLDHEAMSRRILALPELATVFAEHGDGRGGPLEPAQVAALLAGGEGEVGRLLAQVVSGELDADKMDYLLRDSLYCGVRYGSYDLDRLLDTLVPLPDPVTGGWGIGIEAGGVHAAEALVMARYYMFTQVYFNPTGKALELHLNEWLEERGTRWPSDPAAFLEEDDVTVLAALRGSANPHARAVVERRHYPLAFETGEHLAAGERDRFEALLGGLRQRFPRGEMLVSHSAKDPHRFEQSRVLVRHRDGALQPMSEASQFIRHLGRIERFRVYCPEERCGEVAAALRREWTDGAGTGNAAG
jgi:hypothetical protein